MIYLVENQRNVDSPLKFKVNFSPDIIKLAKEVFICILFE